MIEYIKRTVIGAVAISIPYGVFLLLAHAFVNHTSVAITATLGIILLVASYFVGEDIEKWYKKKNIF